MADVAGKEHKVMDNNKDIIIDFRQDTNIPEEIKHWENRFEGDVQNAANAILSASGVNTVALAGPSCSGKTTTAGKLSDVLAKAGKRVVAVSIDDFYRPVNKETEKLRIPDYESPDALDLEMFSTFTTALYEGKAAFAPIYDFKEKNRVGQRRFVPQENDIYIFEGIQAFYPEIYKSLGADTTKRVFINVSSAVTANGMRFEADEIRLIRRILRDFKHRDSSPEFTIRLWDNVRDNEEKRIIPMGKDAEIKINSVMPYDLYVMGTDVYDILDTVDLYSPLYPTVSFIKKKLTRIIPYAILDSDVPADSVIHEFID